MREVAARGDRVRVGLAVVLLAALAWFELWRMSRGGAHGGHAGAGAGHEAAMRMLLPQASPWSLEHWAAAAGMWATMMVAMMLPSATPLLLIFHALQRRRRGEGGPATPTWLLGLGYLLVWTAFAVAAAAVQVALQAALLLSDQLRAASAPVGAALLAVAGLYQLTPAKAACLTQCRSPLGFVTAHWREGPGGAVVLGMRHGLYCLGCCWALMGLLFVVGVMNLLWVALLSALVLVEKTLPAGPRISRVAGAAMLLWAVLVLVGSHTPG